MITTNDQRIADLCRSLRNQGRAAGGGWLAHERLGYNYRLSDINAALGLAQLGRIGEIIACRSKVRKWYTDRLEGERRLVLQKVAPFDVEVSWFVFVVRLADSYGQRERDQILTRLAEQGIGCSNYFVPIHLQPFYVERFGYKPGDFPVCEAVASRTLALPFHHELAESDVDSICAQLQRLL
jgi:perosamine synthetase